MGASLQGACHSVPAAPAGQTLHDVTVAATHQSSLLAPRRLASIGAAVGLAMSIATGYLLR